MDNKPPTSIIEDFAAPDDDHTHWEFITDQVMGGVSTGEMEFIEIDQRNCLHMTGSVSLENNGGFIQSRRAIDPKKKYYNAEGFDGVELWVKGDGETYAVHLRSNNTWLPWQYYQATFTTDGDWQHVRLPFTEFKPYSLKKDLNIQKLKTIAVVAIKKEFKPDIYVERIGFYQENSPVMKKLTPEEERIIVHKGTEMPFSGQYCHLHEKGSYHCKRCGAKLFDSNAKFDSKTGWPSFDEANGSAVKKQLDADGVRTEILCAACGGHLGHVFMGEGYTEKNARFCVNSLSLDFVPDKEPVTQRAIFAAGCFWGVQYHLQRAPGVISTTVGYAGGHVENPTYSQVCTGTTGHAESVEVIFDPAKTSYENLVKLFFETHDFTQMNRQGPDIGQQYRSAIFNLDDQQKKIAEEVIAQLRKKGYDVKTEVTAAGKFWPGEGYHQDYYNKKNGQPYCHAYRKIFD